MSMRRDTHVVFESLVADATMAASSHNTQPWRFEIGENLIRIVPDFTRRCPMVDPDDHHLYVSLGCAAENMVLAAASKEWVTVVVIAQRRPWAQGAKGQGLGNIKAQRAGTVRSRDGKDRG